MLDSDDNDLEIFVSPIKLVECLNLLLLTKTSLIKTFL